MSKPAHAVFAFALGPGLLGAMPARAAIVTRDQLAATAGSAAGTAVLGPVGGIVGRTADALIRKAAAEDGPGIADPRLPPVRIARPLPPPGIVHIASVDDRPRRLIDIAPPPPAPPPGTLDYQLRQLQARQAQARVLSPAKDRPRA